MYVVHPIHGLRPPNRHIMYLIIQNENYILQHSCRHTFFLIFRQTLSPRVSLNFTHTTKTSWLRICLNHGKSTTNIVRDIKMKILLYPSYFKSKSKNLSLSFHSFMLTPSLTYQRIGVVVLLVHLTTTSRCF